MENMTKWCYGCKLVLGPEKYLLKITHQFEPGVVREVVTIPLCKQCYHGLSITGGFQNAEKD